jgi:hypothetical protein
MYGDGTAQLSGTESQWKMLEEVLLGYALGEGDALE